jgi:hypothetical protein
MIQPYGMVRNDDKDKYIAAQNEETKKQHTSRQKINNTQRHIKLTWFTIPKHTHR